MFRLRAYRISALCRGSLAWFCRAFPHHVTQRGNRSQRTFFGDDDCRLYLQLLRRWSDQAATAVWAWCLMPNHVHLILVPSDESGLRRLFGPAHRQYTWRINQREGWRGCLWQGGYGSVAMDEAHLHVCLRYVELNPVRARLVERAEQWPWSSARSHLGLADDGITDVAAMHGRVDDWRALLEAGLAESDRDAIRGAERTGRPLGRPADRRRKPWPRLRLQAWDTSRWGQVPVSVPN